jgi:membrane protease subunit HflK
MANRQFGDWKMEIKRFVDPLAIVVVLSILIAVVFGCYYTVKENERAVVLRFGEYHTTSPPGLHLKIPFVDTVLKVSVEEHSLRLPIGVGGRRNPETSEEITLMLTGDFNAASVEWSIQWKIIEPRDYLFSFYRQDDPDYAENVIRTVARTIMNQQVGDFSLDEVLTEKRSVIAVEARALTQSTLDNFKRGDNAQGCGIMITDLQMQRVTPPITVKPAYDAVLAAIQKSSQLENEANKERNQLLPAARAEADKKIQDAEGYAARRRAEVNGEITALTDKYEAYKNASEVTRQRLYLEAMEKVLSKVESKIIIDADLQQLLPLLQLNPGGTK